MIDVDVILICYNQERYIKEAVDSIFCQHVSDGVWLHLIIADDCSMDNTLNVVRASVDFWQNKCHLFGCVDYLASDSNMGISRNYQRAFAACNGDFVAIMEGDDYWTSSGHLQQHVDFLSQHAECSMSMNSIDDTHGKGYHLVDWQKQIRDGNQLGNLSACMLRNKCVKQLPECAFSIHFDDYLLGVLLSQMGPIGILRESTSVYRCNEQSMWASLSGWKKFKRNLEYIKLYDGIQEGQFHDLWHQCRKNIVHAECARIRTNIAHWFSRKIGGK